MIIENIDWSEARKTKIETRTRSASGAYARTSLNKFVHNFYIFLNFKWDFVWIPRILHFCWLPRRCRCVSCWCGCFVDLKCHQWKTFSQRRTEDHGNYHKKFPFCFTSKQWRSLKPNSIRTKAIFVNKFHPESVHRGSRNFHSLSFIYAGDNLKRGLNIVP